MDYIYRAITHDDLNKLNGNQDIEAPGLCYGINNKFQEYLSDIPTHILSGDTKTMWISLSSDYNICYKKYSNNGNHDSNIRNHVIAVKKNKDFLIDTSEYTDDLLLCYCKAGLNRDLEQANKYLNMIYDLDPNKINKVIFSLSSENSSTKYIIQLLANIGLIKSKYKDNPNYTYRIQNYASKDKEVLMFKQIKNTDIDYILSPLEMDMLYAISRIEDIDAVKSIDKINEIKDYINRYIKYLENDDIFNIFYKRNLTITGYYESIKYANNNNKYINDYIIMKKEVLKKILTQYYYFYKRDFNRVHSIVSLDTRYIPIIEDEEEVNKISLENANKATESFKKEQVELFSTYFKTKKKELL